MDVQTRKWTRAEYELLGYGAEELGALKSEGVI
jgi:hypothetical protein